MTHTERRGRAGVALGGAPQSRVFGGDRGFLNLVIPWLLLCLLLIGTSVHRIAGLQMSDPDDYMRLLQVQDWLAGQSWWDVANYRMGSPLGADMHWSRLVDLPIAAAILLAQPFVSHASAIRFAATAIPLLQLLTAMVLMRGILRCLEFKGASANLGTLILPLLPLLAGAFAPLRIDHHAWQGVIALAMLRMLVDRRTPERRALEAGLFGGLLVIISIEGMPVLAAFGSFYALLFLQGERGTLLRNYLAGIAASAAALFVLTRPFGEWHLPYDDAVSWPQLATFAVAAMAAHLVRPHRSWLGLPQRLVRIGLIGGLALVPLLYGLGERAFRPFSGLDPLLRRYWLDNIGEVRPLWQQPADSAAMLLAMVAIIGLALLLKLPRMRNSGNPRGWLAVCVCAGLMTLLSLLVFRTALTAQLMLAPLCALLLHDALRAANRLSGPLLRVPATLLALIALTPSGGSMAGAAVLRAQHVTRYATSDFTATSCDLSRLANLPRGHVFATLDIGPELLVRTADTVEASGYHRNAAAMLRVVRGFTSTPNAAHAEVRASGADYVVLCKAAGDTQVFLEAGPASLASTLVGEKPPAWLEIVPGFADGGLAVYRVIK